MAIFLCIFSLLVYRAAGGVQTSEGFLLGFPMAPVTEAINGQTGQSDNCLLSSQWYASTNPIVNTNMIRPDEVSQLQAGLSTIQRNSMAQINSMAPRDGKQENIYSRIVKPSNEGYCAGGARTSVPTYEVPGYRQSYLSPRQSSTGLQSYIRYNIPDEKNLAVRSNDPLMMKESYCNPVQLANIVQPVKEGFTSSSLSPNGDVSVQYNKLQQQNQQTSSTTVLNELPIQSMATSIGGDDPAIVNYSRNIYASRRSRLAGNADKIRGDVWCTPCLPNQDPSSFIAFRPSVNPSVDLSAGAMGVMGGFGGNTTAYQTAEFMSRSSGGQNTFSGVALPYPTDTAQNNLQVAQQVALSGTDMGNQFAGVASQASSPYESVTFSSFA